MEYQVRSSSINVQERAVSCPTDAWLCAARSRISQLEEQNLAEKPWQQRGETSAATRHENALLEEYVDFEQTRRAPETTAEVGCR